MHATNHDTTYSQSHTDHTDHTTDVDDDALVIPAKHATLTEARKMVLRKGLKFIPKPKTLPMQALHGDIKNFMHRIYMDFRTNSETRRSNKGSI